MATGSTITDLLSKSDSVKYVFLAKYLKTNWCANIRETACFSVFLAVETEWFLTLKGSYLSLSLSHHTPLKGGLIMECPYIKYQTGLWCSESHYTQHHAHFSSVATQIYEFHMPLRKYTAVTEQGHDRRPWSIFEWKAIWEVFKAFSSPLSFFLSRSLPGTTSGKYRLLRSSS